MKFVIFYYSNLEVEQSQPYENQNEAQIFYKNLGTSIAKILINNNEITAMNPEDENNYYI